MAKLTGKTKKQIHNFHDLIFVPEIHPTTTATQTELKIAVTKTHWKKEDTESQRKNRKHTLGSNIFLEYSNFIIRLCFDLKQTRAGVSVNVLTIEQELSGFLRHISPALANEGGGAGVERGKCGQ